MYDFFFFFPTRERERCWKRLLKGSGGEGRGKAGADSWTNRECVAVVERSVGQWVINEVVCPRPGCKKMKFPSLDHRGALFHRTLPLTLPPFPPLSPPLNYTAGERWRGAKVVTPTPLPSHLSDIVKPRRSWQAGYPFPPPSPLLRIIRPIQSPILLLLRSANKSLSPFLFRRSWLSTEFESFSRSKEQPVVVFKNDCQSYSIEKMKIFVWEYITSWWYIAVSVEKNLKCYPHLDPSWSVKMIYIICVCVYIYIF